MAVWWTLVLRLLEQEIGNSRSPRRMLSFVATATIIPFMPDGWAASAGGFPAMTERVAFLMKDIVLFAASFYLLKQDVLRVAFGKHQQLIRHLPQAPVPHTIAPES
jgi:uncharacterized membrane protein YkgB